MHSHAKYRLSMHPVNMGRRETPAAEYAELYIEP